MKFDAKFRGDYMCLEEGDDIGLASNFTQREALGMPEVVLRKVRIDEEGLFNGACKKWLTACFVCSIFVFFFQNLV